MRTRVFAIALILAILIPGINASAADRPLDAAKNIIEESAVVPASRRVTTPADIITREQAQNIALEHAGFTADQVTRLRTEYEIDDGVARYEVHFRQGRREYDYEINANTGAILSYDADD